MESSSLRLFVFLLPLLLNAASVYSHGHLGSNVKGSGSGSFSSSGSFSQASSSSFSSANSGSFSYTGSGLPQSQTGNGFGNLGFSGSMAGAGSGANAGSFAGSGAAAGALAGAGSFSMGLPGMQFGFGANGASAGALASNANPVNQNKDNNYNGAVAGANAGAFAGANAGAVASAGPQNYGQVDNHQPHQQGTIGISVTTINKDTSNKPRPDYTHQVNVDSGVYGLQSPQQTNPQNQSPIYGSVDNKTPYYAYQGTIGAGHVSVLTDNTHDSKQKVDSYGNPIEKRPMKFTTDSSPPQNEIHKPVESGATWSGGVNLVPTINTGHQYVHKQQESEKDKTTYNNQNSGHFSAGIGMTGVMVQHQNPSYQPASQKDKTIYDGQNLGYFAGNVGNVGVLVDHKTPSYSVVPTHHEVIKPNREEVPPKPASPAYIAGTFDINHKPSFSHVGVNVKDNKPKYEGSFGGAPGVLSATGPAPNYPEKPITGLHVSVQTTNTGGFNAKPTQASHTHQIPTNNNAVYAGSFGGAPGIITATGPAENIDKVTINVNKIPPTNSGVYHTKPTQVAHTQHVPPNTNVNYAGGFGGASGIITATGTAANNVHKNDNTKYTGTFGGAPGILVAIGPVDDTSKPAPSVGNVGVNFNTQNSGAYGQANAGAFSTSGSFHNKPANVNNQAAASQANAGAFGASGSYNNKPTEGVYQISAQKPSIGINVGVYGGQPQSNAGAFGTSGSYHNKPTEGHTVIQQTGHDGIQGTGHHHLQAHKETGLASSFAGASASAGSFATSGSYSGHGDRNQLGVADIRAPLGSVAGTQNFAGASASAGAVSGAGTLAIGVGHDVKGKPAAGGWSGAGAGGYAGTYGIHGGTNTYGLGINSGNKWRNNLQTGISQLYGIKKGVIQALVKDMTGGVTITSSSDAVGKPHYGHSAKYGTHQRIAHRRHHGLGENAGLKFQISI